MGSYASEWAWSQALAPRKDLIVSWPSIDHSLISPNGRISKRARKAAMVREYKKLFPEGLPAPTCAQPSERERLLREANELDALANRGMRVRRFRKQAVELRARAEALPQ